MKRKNPIGCAICPEVFIPKSKNHLYCSKDCAKEKKYDYKRDLRKISKEIGNCTKCHRKNPNHKYNWCMNCRKYYREYCEGRKKG